MMLCPTLGKVQRRYVDFDPTNKDHLEAYRLLALGVIQEDGKIKIRQHKVLRFYLIAPFVDVPSMMAYMVGTQYLKHIGHVPDPAA